MRRLLAIFLLALLGLGAMPSAQATLNKATPFSTEIDYMQGLDTSGEMGIVSGAMDASLAGAPGAFGFFEARGMIVTGIDKVCYNASPCPERPAGTLSLEVATGGSFALCFPTPPRGRLEADHALAMFVNLATDDDLNTFPVGKSLVVPAIDGTLSFAPVAAVPASGLSGSSALATPCTTSAGLSALDATTQVTIRDGTNVVATLVGKDARVLFTGQVAIPIVHASFLIAPFAAGSTVHFEAARQDAARAGLDVTRVQDLIRMLDASHASSTVDRTDTGNAGAGTQEFLADLLNGALLGLPNGPGNGSAFPVADVQFARFTTLTIDGTSAGLTGTGRATLEIDNGQVTGAKPLVGVGPLQLPWWSYLLWAVALTLFIVRLVLKPDKTHPRWDRFKWVGWVATPVAWLVVVLLWDAEVNAVLGSSLLHGSSGQARMIIGLAELTLLAIIAFLAAAPLRVILRNTSLLAHQGTFMGLAGAVAALLGFLLGATYLRAYLGLILEQVMDRLA